VTREAFEQIVEEEFPNAVPEQFRHLIKNVAFLIEDEAPSRDLLGYYQGIPATARGDIYGVGMTLPDTITLYQKTIEREAEVLANLAQLEGASGANSQQGMVGVRQDFDFVRRVVRDTIWHEVAHHFGYDEHQVRAREEKRYNSQ
jgi:predicted Zn-dependent protease with MMP-like domain